jgi:tripartite-type tricarboxylate transporter receptor subunit TctC
MVTRKVAASVAIVGILLAPLADIVNAQSVYPSKPVRLILPYAPGGSTSVVARLIGQKLVESLGHQVIVDNRPGGNTIIGSEALVRSPPDGYTLLLVTSTHTINANLIKTPYDAIKDFAAVSTLTRAPFALIVHPSLPAKNVREFVSLARSRPGQLDYASSGTGTSNHVAAELFSIVAKIKMHHIPYKGGGPALIDVMGGQVQVHINVPVVLIPNIKSGRVKGLAVTGESRLSALPEIPTFIEAGFPAFNMKNWNGILAPAGTPKAVIDKLNAEIGKVLQMPDIREKMIAQGTEAWVSTPEQFSALIRSEVDTFAKVVKAADIKAE